MADENWWDIIKEGDKIVVLRDYATFEKGSVFTFIRSDANKTVILRNKNKLFLCNYDRFTEYFILLTNASRTLYANE